MRVFLIDGTNLVMRYASAMVPDLDQALPGDVERVCRAVERAIRECAITAAGCQHAIIALDSVDSWRKREYAEYKATRLGTTGVWSNRLNIALTARGFLCERAHGFEADDIIATRVARAAVKGHTSAVLSGDSDLLALASLFCDVIQFGKKGVEPRFVKRPMAWIAEKYGIGSALNLRGYKALVGEPGDNLPGVPGIGPVKAKKLFAEYETIEKILASGALNVEQVDQCMLMLRLVTLREDVPLDAVTPAACKIPPAPQEPANEHSHTTR